MTEGTEATGRPVQYSYNIVDIQGGPTYAIDGTQVKVNDCVIMDHYDGQDTHCYHGNAVLELEYEAVTIPLKKE